MTITVPEGYRTVREAAALTGNSPDTIRQWIRAGRLPFVQAPVYYVPVDAIANCRQRDRLTTKVPDLPPEGMITTRDAARMTGAPIRTIQNWASTTRIHATKCGGKWYVSEADLQTITHAQ